MISHLVKGCLCWRLLPIAAAVSSSTTARAQRATWYHHHHHRRPVAFGWTAGEGSRSTTTATRAVAAQQQSHLQELKDVPASTLATIEAVASDVDGTLTTPDVTVTSRTKEAIKAVMDSGLVFFPATGKVSMLYTYDLDR